MPTTPAPPIPPHVIEHFQPGDVPLAYMPLAGLSATDTAALRVQLAGLPDGAYGIVWPAGGVEMHFEGTVGIVRAEPPNFVHVKVPG